MYQGPTAYDLLAAHELSKLHVWYQYLLRVHRELLPYTNGLSIAELIEAIDAVTPIADNDSRLELELALCIYPGRSSLSNITWLGDYLQGFKVVDERAKSRIPPYNFVWLYERAGLCLTIWCAVERIKASYPDDLDAYCDKLREFSDNRTIGLILQCARATDLREPKLMAALVHSHGILDGIAQWDLEPLSNWGRQSARRCFYSGAFNLTYYMQRKAAAMQRPPLFGRSADYADQSIPELAWAISNDLADQAMQGYAIERFRVVQKMYRQLKVHFAALN